MLLTKTRTTRPLRFTASGTRSLEKFLLNSLVVRGFSPRVPERVVYPNSAV